MKSVSWLLFDSLDSGRGQFDTYYERLSDTVPTPATRILELDTSQREPWDTEAVLNAMDNLGVERAFVRTMQKAAPRDIHSGSLIQEPTADEVDQTISSLLTQTATSEWDHGGKIAVRELLDLRFCMGDKHTMCHPEIRYFIEGGEVLFKVPESVGFSCPQKYSHLEELLQNASPPDKLAERVASEFTELPWAVDFALATDGEWYCLEMNLNGVRWDGENEKWRNMCGYGDKEYLSHEVVHAPVLKKFE